MEEILAAVARIAIGGLFLIAGVAKLRSGHTNFLRAVLGYDLLRGRRAALFARALPPIEIAIGVALIVGIAPGPVTFVTLGLLTVVTGAVIRSLVLGRAHHCACIGFTWAQVQSVQWSIAYRNWLLAMILLAVAAREGGSFAACRVIGGCQVAPVTAVILTSAGAVVLTASALVIAWLHWRARVGRSSSLIRPEPG